MRVCVHVCVQVFAKNICIYIYIYICIMHLEEKSNLYKLPLKSYINEEYHYTLPLIRLLFTFNLMLEYSKYGLQSIYMCEKKEEKTYIN